jgi:hypothetical protein
MRPSGIGTYSLQGTKASYGSAYGIQKIFIEGRSKSEIWDPLDKYKSQYQSEYWAQRGAEAAKAGHGGGDYFVISDFLDGARTGHCPVDAIDAATWTVIRPLSEESVRHGGKPIDIPDFRKA